jgi:hypothetical protein
MRNTPKSNEGTRLAAALAICDALVKAGKEPGNLAQVAAASEDAFHEVQQEALEEAVGAAVDEFASMGGQPEGPANRTEIWERVDQVLTVKGWPESARRYTIDVAADMVNDGNFDHVWEPSGAPTVGPAPVPVEVTAGSVSVDPAGDPESWSKFLAAVLESWEALLDAFDLDDLSLFSLDQVKAINRARNVRDERERELKAVRS